MTLLLLMEESSSSEGYKQEGGGMKKRNSGLLKSLLLLKNSVENLPLKLNLLDETYFIFPAPMGFLSTLTSLYQL